MPSFISHFIWIQDLFAEMTGARTVPRAPLMHWFLDFGGSTGILFRRPQLESKYIGIVGSVGIKFTKPPYWMGAKRLRFCCTRHILASVNWQRISCAQIFVRGQCVGGCDDLLALQQDGTLQKAPG